MENRSFWDTYVPPTYEQLLNWIESHQHEIKLIEDEEQRLLEAGVITDQEYEDRVRNSTVELRGYIADSERLIKKLYPDRVTNPVGRPKIGVRRQVKMTLPAEDWELIEQAVSSGSAASIADYFRQLHDQAKQQ